MQKSEVCKKNGRGQPVLHSKKIVYPSLGRARVRRMIGKQVDPERVPEQREKQARDEHNIQPDEAVEQVAIPGPGVAAKILQDGA